MKIAAPEGLTTFCSRFPSVKVVRRTFHLTAEMTPKEFVQITGWIDQGLNEKAYIIPGLGDFGERR